MNRLPLSKLLHPRNFPRYARELPWYLRGVARARTLWGDTMLVPFPEFRSVVEEGYITGHGEEAVYEYLNTHLTQKDIFFDIGANAGFYTLFGAHKGAHTYAFEPFPSTLRLLRENTKNKKVEVVPLALSNSSAGVHMEEGRHPGLNKVSTTGAVAAPSTTLDEFGVIPTFMKVDVEGHEMQVFVGGLRLLAEHSPTIIAEVSPESKAYLVSLGYTATLLGKVNYLFVK